MKGLRVAGSYNELKRQIADYLADPTLDAEGRALTRERECGEVDGHASERIAHVLADLVGRQPSASVSETLGLHG